MRRAHASAARAFLVTVSGPEVWGWQGRTLGRRAGTDWLRVVSAPVAKQGGRLWEGTALADALVPRQLLQACSRGVHPRLAPLLARRAEDLTGTPVPLP
ncbi:hypothetical protein ACFV5J_16100 [Streptomyces zaomyceticus]|uniref:hypothetical protein n=1 Tax=Streptomyces zaomyceticus TaxID=68286 RepID=UPI00365A4B57